LLKQDHHHDTLCRLSVRKLGQNRFWYQQ